MRIDSVMVSRGLYSVKLTDTIEDKEVSIYATQEYNPETERPEVKYGQYGIDYNKKEVPQDFKDILDKVLEFVTRRF